MFKFQYICVVIAFLRMSSLSESEATNASDISHRTINGSPIDINDVPYQVSLQNGTLYPELSHFCGGGFISNVWILTAAHCLVDIDPKKLYIRAGSTFVNSGGIILKVTTVVVHPSYNKKRLRYDIGLVLRAKPSPDPPVFGTLILPAENQNYPDNTLFRIAGWGVASGDSQTSSPSLNALDLPKISNEQCNAHFDVPLTRDDICAGYNDGRKIACDSDTGGPLTHNNIVYGIASKLCSTVRIFTRVPSFTKWIRGITAL